MDLVAGADKYETMHQESPQTKLEADQSRGVTLITGAASGIGRAFARALAERGQRLLLVDQHGDELARLADRLGQSAPQVIALPLDLSIKSTPRLIFNYCNENDLEVTTLINNAAVGTHAPFVEQTLWRIEEIVRVNVLALITLTRLFVPRMLERGEGTIVNVTSIAAFEVSPGWSVYAATKAFVQNFTETLGEELTPRGILVSAVCPGMTRTNFFTAAGTETPPDVQDPDEVVAEALAGLERRQRLIVTGRSNRVRIHAQRANLRRLMANIKGGLRRVGLVG